MRNRMASAIRPEITRTSVEMCMLRLLLQNLFPSAHVRDAAFITGDDPLGATVNPPRIFAARGRGLAGAVAHIQNLSDAVSANGTRDMPQHAHHLVIGGIHGALAC